MDVWDANMEIPENTPGLWLDKARRVARNHVQTVSPIRQSGVSPNRNSLACMK
jgi:hypothetical protein